MEALSSSSNGISHLFHAGEDSGNRFRLVLVHGGLQHLDQAIDDLRDRSFPADAEVLLLSVSDLFRTSLHLAGKSHAPSGAVRVNPRSPLPKHKKTQAFFDHLESAARQAVARLQAAFPRWEIRFERPLAWQPSLIYFCPLDPAPSIRLGLSEIIRKISTESNVPLIIARRQPERRTSQRFSVVVFDGPAGAQAVLHELRRRSADQAGELYLIQYKDSLMSAAERWRAGYDVRDCEWLDGELVKTRSAIEALGYKVSCMNVVGNTALAVLQEAGRVEAESILLGIEAGSASMAASVAAQANCPVEVVFADQSPQPAALTRHMAAVQKTPPWNGSNQSPAGLSSSL